MWNYIAEKAFPYECPFCGCGHSFPQETCDRCHKVVNRKKTPIHTLMPMVDSWELEKTVNQQFGCGIKNIRNLLFDDDYQNDCYKAFYYADMEECEDWMGDVDEEAVRQRNLVRAYLQDTIPDYTYVLIDVSW